MAIINESGIKRDTDASESSLRHPNSVSPQSPNRDIQLELSR